MITLQLANTAKIELNFRVAVKSPSGKYGPKYLKKAQIIKVAFLISEMKLFKQSLCKQNTLCTENHPSSVTCITE